MADPLQSLDPWCVQDAKGRVRTESARGPSARTFGDFLPSGDGPKRPLGNIEFGDRSEVDVGKDATADAVAWAVEQPGMKAWIASQPREAREAWDRQCRRSAEVVASESRLPWFRPKPDSPKPSDSGSEGAAPKFCDPNMLKSENPFQFGVYPSPSLIQEAISGPRFFQGPSGGM